MTVQPGDGATFVGHSVLDVPAEHPTLKFEQIAEALATIVLASEPRFAVGIFGGWGSGKSTLMDQIERVVTKENKAIVVRFNAWRYEREPHLIVPLLDTIRAALAEWAARPQISAAAGERVRNIAGRIGRVVRALVRATSFDIGVPGAVTISVDPGKALDEMSEHPEDPAASPQSLYYGAFQELAGAFADVENAGPSRIVVFVDDLDRCLPERALTVLESMKLFFDMPGFVFIVGLDERVVESAVRTKFAGQQDNNGHEFGRQLEREYLKKIFQVPYTLPALVPAQLDDLLTWLNAYGKLGEVQRQDLNERVRSYLRYVATEGRINPREVKRFINAYTLHRMIGPDLNPDTVLALQTIDFRSDWEKVYEDVILAEPDIFPDVLQRFRGGDNHAFEDLWPEIGVLPLELSEFLRSPQAAALAESPDLERYVALLETTHSMQGWAKDAMRDVGNLRRYIRDVRPPLQIGDDGTREIAKRMKDVLGRLSSYQMGSSVTRLERPLEKLRDLVSALAPSVTGQNEPVETAPQQLDEWRKDASAQTDALQQELRLIRRSSAFGAN
jgi:energy-coupling factor transporter ATP-binding protein EcfA2